MELLNIFQKFIIVIIDLMKYFNKSFKGSTRWLTAINVPIKIKLFCILPIYISPVQLLNLLTSILRFIYRLIFLVKGLNYWQFFEFSIYNECCKSRRGVWYLIKNFRFGRLVLGVIFEKAMNNCLIMAACQTRLNEIVHIIDTRRNGKLI